MTVTAFIPSTDRADSLLSHLKEQAEEARSILGVDLAGFALVAWDMRGQVRTVIHAQEGAVGLPLVPAFAHDALNRHVCVVLHQNAVSEGLDDA